MKGAQPSTRHSKALETDTSAWFPNACHAGELWSNDDVATARAHRQRGNAPRAIRGPPKPIYRHSCRVGEMIQNGCIIGESNTSLRLRCGGGSRGASGTNFRLYSWFSVAVLGGSQPSEPWGCRQITALDHRCGHDSRTCCPGRVSDAIEHCHAMIRGERVALQRRVHCKHPRDRPIHKIVQKRCYSCSNTPLAVGKQKHLLREAWDCARSRDMLVMSLSKQQLLLLKDTIDAII